MTAITPALTLENYRNKRILIIGSSGYLANNLLHMLKDVECQITRVAASGKILTLVNGACKVHDVISDLNQTALWQQVLPHTDIIFHFAGQSNIQQANQAPVEDIKRSITPFLLLLDTCRQNDLHPHIVLASSVSLYGNTTTENIDETHPDQPNTIYDLHKLHAEEYLHYYIKNNYVTGCSLRLTNVYGPGIQTSNKIKGGLINHAIRSAIENEPVSIYGTGHNQRDYIYLDDASRAFLAAGLAPAQVNGERFIIGNGHSHTVTEVVNKITAQLAQWKNVHSSIRTQPKAQRDLDERHFVSKSAKFYYATGWQPLVSLDEGIALTVKAQ